MKNRTYTRNGSSHLGERGRRTSSRKAITGQALEDLRQKNIELEKHEISTKNHDTMTTATKQTEITMLEEIMSLDGYLADSLSQDDLRIMKNNINNDFPIFTGTSVDRSLQVSNLQSFNISMESQISNLEAAIKTRETIIGDQEAEIDGLKEIKRGIILQAITSDALHLVEDFCTANEVLRIKLENDIHLTASENKALLSLLER